MAARISGVLDDIRAQRLEGEFHALSACDDDSLDLEAGAFLIARFAYPDLDVTASVDILDAMAREVRERLGRKASGEEIVKAINRYLFVEQGFAGNTHEYYDIDNSYLNKVLERKTGIPISLSAVYLLVGRRLELPVFGVGMPGHFLVKYEADRYRIFVDSFNGGALLTQKDCARFLDQAGYGFDERYLQKTPSRAILIRMIKNLVALYNKMNDQAKAVRLTRFIEILGLPEKDE
jgi:regulator of sirC expression with transglutaminase-like and TPR domain